MRKIQIPSFRQFVTQIHNSKEIKKDLSTFVFM